MKIKFLPYQPHCFAFGGFEIQMLSAFKALESLGVNVEKMDVWSRDNDYQIAHCWGLDLANYENVKWAKKSGKIVVITALVGYYEDMVDRIKFRISSSFYKERLIKEMVTYIDRFVVLNELQAKIIHEHYGIAKDRIHIIPNIVDERFYQIANESPIISDYVLIVGNVCTRKNQLALAKACVLENLKLIIIGGVLRGEEGYGEQLTQIVNNNVNISWIKGLKENSDELLDYYKKCSIFALPSFIEQQPISLLEAAVMNKPLIIANKAYGKQKYYENSYLVNPKSVRSIQNGLRKVINDKSSYLPNQNLLKECKSENVGRAYMEVYHRFNT